MVDSTELSEAIRKLFHGRKSVVPERTPVDISPGCAFGAVVDQRLKDMSEQIEELKGRINGLIFLVIGAVIVELVMRFITIKGG